MQFKVCKCFTIQGQAYEPEGGTNAEALNVFEGSPNHVSTLKAGGYICEMEEGIGYVSDPDKSLASGLVEDTVDGYSEQGVSDGSQLDAEGDPIPAGNKITTYYDATGAVVNSRDDEKTQGSTTTPSADGLGQVITTSDNETTYVADAQLTGPVLNATTGMLEMLDQDGNVSGEPWFPVSPKNQTKISLAPADGQVLDGNGVAVSATTITGQPILAGDRVIVECDPDTGAVIQVMTNALPKDCVLSINGEAPDADGDYSVVTLVNNEDLTYTVTPANGDPAYVIDTRCKQYIEMDIEPCPIVFPLCGVSATGDTELTDAASIQSFLNANYGDELVFNEADCTIKGCMLADVDFDLEFRKPVGAVNFSVEAGELAIAKLITSDGSDVSIKWPDGSVITVASGVAPQATTAIAGDVEITVQGCACVTQFEISGPWSFDISALDQFVCLEGFVAGSGNVTTGDIGTLPDTLLLYRNQGSNTTYGDIGDLPEAMESFENQGQNTTTGDLAGLPLGMTYYYNAGQNTTYGDIAGLPAGLIYYNNQGQNVTTGDIGTLSVGLTYYRNSGQNTTFGDIGTLPLGLSTYINQGQNVTTGDIGTLPSGLTRYDNQGSNTTLGDIGTLPAGLTSYTNLGVNTTDGDIGALPVGLKLYRNSGQNSTFGDIGTLPAGLTYYENSGVNTTTGDVGTLPSGLTFYLNGGSNTTDGDIGGIPAGLTYYRNEGLNTANVAAGSTLPSTMTYFLSHPSPGYTTAEIDLLLQSLTTVGSWTGAKDVFVAGSNAAPSAAGAALIPTILANGADQVVTN